MIASQRKMGYYDTTYYGTTHYVAYSMLEISLEKDNRMSTSLSRVTFATVVASCLLYASSPCKRILKAKPSELDPEYCS